MVKAYRFYYTTFYDEEHERVKAYIKGLFGIEPIEHTSRIPGFRWIEVRFTRELPKVNIESLIESLKKMLGGDAYVRVDVIDL
ncbi:MAG: hypothetical protein QXU97_01605 [Fervidicoccaceae archaeon]